MKTLLALLFWWFPTKPKKKHYPPLRAAFMEDAAAQREMKREF
jgi:hypothetical protein